MSINTLSPEQFAEHENRIHLGEKARNFLVSDDWKTLVKPIIDSMLKGLTDIRNLKSADIESEKKAGPEIKARKLTAEYLEQIETFLNGYIIDGEESTKQLERNLKANTLYKTVD
ncbi:MAG: hypothetical protein AAB875_00865 [Patescibacteria group bacterium]